VSTIGEDIIWREFIMLGHHSYIRFYEIWWIFSPTSYMLLCCYSGWSRLHCCW